MRRRFLTSKMAIHARRALGDAFSRAEAIRIACGPLLLCVFFLGWSLPAFAAPPPAITTQEGADAPDENDAHPDSHPVPRDVYLVFAGGASLGAYEAGYATILVQFLRDHPDRFTLRGISGTSAGGINAFAAALEYCKDDAYQIEDDAPQSVPYQTWIPMGWSMIYDADKVSSEAIFHTDALFEHGLALLEPTDYALRRDCRVPIHITVTQESRREQHAEPTHALDMIEYIGVELRATNEGRARYVQLPPRDHRPPHRVTLPARKNGTISAHHVMRAITASAAFPMGFPSVKMTVEGPSDLDPDNRTVTLERRYYDGGIFDNVPVAALFRDLQTNVNAHDANPETFDPLVMIVDLKNQRLPQPSSSMQIGDGNLGTMTSRWMSYARARSYAEASQTLKDAEIDTWRAVQRYPAASEFLAAFAGFLDRTFRETDYLLGAHDALEDLRQAQETTDLSLPTTDQHVACMDELLRTNTFPECVNHVLSDSIIATLRGIAAAGASRCDHASLPTMGCASFEEEALLERLPKPTRKRAQERKLRRAPAFSPNRDLDAFLTELTYADFHPSLTHTWPDMPARLRNNPTYLYSRLVEDAFHVFAAQQNNSALRTEVAFDTLLQASLAVPPRVSLSALINLHSLEATFNIPLSHRWSVDAGGTAEWGVQSDRTKGWHLMSGGPVLRIGVNFSKSSALMAIMGDVHTGVLFGPTFDSVVHERRGVGLARSKSVPNAAAFVGIAPRIFILRRLQIDLPIRAYWLCANTSCTSFVDRAPAYSISVRIGWNWTLPSRIQPADR